MRAALPNLRRPRTLVAVAAILGLAAVPVVTAGRSADAKDVRLATPAWREIRPSVFASGQIVHGNEVRLTSEVIGTVEAVYVDEGESVRQGDVLLAIDDEAHAAQVARNEAAVRLQEIDIERRRLAIGNLERQRQRSERLHARGLLDQHSFEAAQHGVRLAEIDLRTGQEQLAQARSTLDQSREQLAKTRIRAPIDGIVTALEIEAGETAMAGTTNIPGSALMVIADPSSTLTEVFVDEADVADVRPGQAAEVVAVAYPERPFAGAVAFVASAAKPRPNGQGLAFRVRIRLDGAEAAALLSGMSCRAEIFAAGEGRALAVPIASIISEEDLAARTVQHHVYVAELGTDGRGIVRKRAVEVGAADDEFQAIRSGVGAEQRVVAGPSRVLRSLRDGDPVAAQGS